MQELLLVQPGPSSIENDVHGIEKLLLKTQVSLTSFLHSEVNQIIHIIVQDQDGQNSNIIIFRRWLLKQICIPTGIS